jgi:cytochrome P450
MITREATEDAEIEGIPIKKNDLILMDLVGMHRREDLFDDPLEFKPERFEDPNFDKNSFKPFGTGPRACIGSPMAKPEAQVFLSKVFGSVNLEPVEQLEGEEHFFTMRPKGKLLVKVSPA